MVEMGSQKYRKMYTGWETGRQVAREVGRRSVRPSVRPGLRASRSRWPHTRAIDREGRAGLITRGIGCGL